MEERLHRLLKGCSEKDIAYYDVGYYMGFKDGLITKRKTGNSEQEAELKYMVESVDECIDDAMCDLKRIITEEG